MRWIPALILAMVLAGQGESSKGVQRIFFKLFKVGKDIAGITGPAGAIVKSVLEFTTEDKNKELLRRFEDVTGQLRVMEQELGSISSGIRNIEQSVVGQVSWGRTVDTLMGLLRPVDSKYRRFVNYQQNPSSFQKYTLDDFTMEALAHSSDSLHSTMDGLRDLVLGGRSSASTRRRKRNALNAGLFRKLKSVLQDSRSTVCGLGQSPQQLAYVLYGTIAQALAKTFSMVQFSYKMFRLLGRGSFTAEEEHFSASFQNISLEVAREAKAVMHGMSTDFWRCDPAQHQRGVTYEEVTQLLQGYVEGEVDLSPSNSCTGKCHHFETASSLQSCYGDSYFGTDWSPLCENQRRCNGNLYDCKELAPTATICLSSSSYRRYNWIEKAGGTTLGLNDGSHGSCAKTQKVEEWADWFVHCSYCFCLCDDKTNSHRYFSLKPAVSDIAENKIVTGVRLKKIDGIFYIQVEQGVAGIGGSVKSSMGEWKSVNRNSRKTSRTDKDLLVLSYEKRDVVLRNLKAPSDHVVTGVSFRNWGDYLTVKIQVTAISQEGVLDPESSHWVTEPLDLGQKIPHLDLGSSPIPSTIVGAPSWPQSRSNNWLTFVPSSIEKDAAQTTLPLLDIQPVAPRPAVWLTGIRLYHKGQQGGGGFLGLRVTTVDMSLSG